MKCLWGGASVERVTYRRSRSIEVSQPQFSGLQKLILSAVCDVLADAVMSNKCTDAIAVKVASHTWIFVVPAFARLHLIDFEQLKIENQTVNEKIEERNEELLKLRKKNTTTVQVAN